MNIDKNSDLNAPFASAYRELFDNIRPSEQLLAATRGLYTARSQQPGGWRKPAFRLWPAAAASLCAACLLLTIGLHFWPQPEEIAPPANTLRTADQLTESYAVNNSLPQDNPKVRTAPAPAAEQNQNIEPMSMDSTAENTPELCAYPLAKQNDQAYKPFIKPAEFIRLNKPGNIWQLMPQWAARALNWLTLW